MKAVVFTRYLHLPALVSTPLNSTESRKNQNYAATGSETAPGPRIKSPVASRSFQSQPGHGSEHLPRRHYHQLCHLHHGLLRHQEVWRGRQTEVGSQGHQVRPDQPSHFIPELQERRRHGRVYGHVRGMHGRRGDKVYRSGNRLYRSNLSLLRLVHLYFYLSRMRKDRALSEISKHPFLSRLQSCPAIQEWKSSGRPLYKATDKCTSEKIEAVVAKFVKQIWMEHAFVFIDHHVTGPRTALTSLQRTWPEASLKAGFRRRCVISWTRRGYDFFGGSGFRCVTIFLLQILGSCVITELGVCYSFEELDYQIQESVRGLKMFFKHFASEVGLRFDVQVRDRELHRHYNQVKNWNVVLHIWQKALATSWHHLFS